MKPLRRTDGGQESACSRGLIRVTSYGVRHGGGNVKRLRNLTDVDLSVAAKLLETEKNVLRIIKIQTHAALNCGRRRVQETDGSGCQLKLPNDVFGVLLPNSPRAKLFGR